jgi:hypothetical protein
MQGSCIGAQAQNLAAAAAATAIAASFSPAHVPMPKWYGLQGLMIIIIIQSCSRGVFFSCAIR